MRKFLRRLSALLHRGRLRRELEEEMAAHLERLPTGRRQNFGSTLRFQEEAADLWGWTWFDHFRQDLAYGARSLRRSPAFALTAIAVLSLGIGVNLAEVHVFSAFLHHLHIRDAGSLFQIYRIERRANSAFFSVPEIEFYRRANTALSAVLTETRVDGIHIAQDPADLRDILVSGNYFPDLGITPLYGRLLDPRDDRPGAPPVAVLAYDYWRSRFGADPGVVTNFIRLNDKPVQVVGVASPDFGGIAWNAQLWMPLAQCNWLTGLNPADYRNRWTQMYGRLKPGLSPDAAQAQFRSLAAELARQQPEFVDSNEWLKLRPADDRQLAPTPAALLLLTTCITLVLLVLFSACANLGNMLLARGIARRREIEIRLAIGAGRARLVRQLLTENLLLAGLASIAALFTGRMAALLLLKLTGAPSRIRIVTDWHIVLACAALGLLAALAFGLAPALHIVRGGAAPTRARKILVAVQVAASCVLLILSSFFTRSIQRSFRTEATFDYSGLAIIDPALYMHPFSPAQCRQSASDIVARVRGVPGVQGATIIASPPLRRWHVERASGQPVYVSQVDPSYFAVMRLPLLAGHVFGPEEPDGVVISNSAARRLWPGQPPLGKIIRVAQRDRTVSGVVKDSGVNLMVAEDSVEAYLPIEDRDARLAAILVRTARDPAPLTAALRSAASTPEIAPTVFTLEGLVNDRLDSIRKMVHVVGSLAAIASLLALVGMFGLLAFTVAQRTREIGVRMALGARTADILRIVLGPYALPFGAGAAAGVLLAAATARIMRNILYGYARFDLVSVAAGLMLFALITLAAAVAPAHRALRIDPACALRHE